MGKSLVLLSGGLDSTVCLYRELMLSDGQPDMVVPFCINYGQRHVREVNCAHDLVNLSGTNGMCVTLNGVLAATTPLLTDEPLPEFQSAAEVKPGPEATFIPGRNLFFIALAANHAVAMGADTLVMGVSQRGAGGYPDARQFFIAAAEAAVRRGSGSAAGNMRISTPLMHLSKKETVELALRTPGCYGALGFTHTAYDGNYPPTGVDRASVLRAHGFVEAGVPDPLMVRAYWEGHVLLLPPTENYMFQLFKIPAVHCPHTFPCT